MKLLSLALVAAWSLAASAAAQSSAPPQWSPAVIEANLAAAMEDESRRHAFLTSFLNGEVWVRVEQSSLDAAAEHQRSGAPGRVPLQMFAGDVEGQTVIFAFTRPELAPAAFGQEVPLLGMSGEAALRAQSQVGLSLNYNNGPGVIFTPEDIAALLATIQYQPATPPPASPH